MVTKITCEMLDSALDHPYRSTVWLRMALIRSANQKAPRYWAARRNGKMRTWKRSPDRFAVPVKAGISSYTTLTEGSTISIIGEDNWQAADVVLSTVNPSTLYYLSNFEINGKLSSQKV